MGAPLDDLTAARDRWSGGTAVITGAGSGLGAGFAEVAAGLGMIVVLAGPGPGCEDVAALITGSKHAAYEVTKHGVLALSESIAEGLAEEGAAVQISVALPGPVQTRIYADANNGPLDPLAAAERARALTTMLDEQGVTPVDAARTLLAQTAQGTFAVTTHPDMMKSMAATRAQQLLAKLGVPD
jgi:short-subunit dehydrogenase